MRRNLRNKILILALLPTLSISVLLGSYLSYTRLLDLRAFNLERGQANSRQLAVMAQYALQANDKKLQQAIANAALEEKGVRSVTIYDEHQRLLIHAGPRMQQPLKDISPFTKDLVSRATEDGVRFALPVRTQYLIGDIQQSPSLPVNAGDKMIGWVEVEYSNDSVTLKKYQTILTSALLISLGLFSTLILVIRASRQIFQHIEGLTDAITHVRNGDLDIHLEVKDSGELGRLGEEINQMASAVKRSYEDMQHNVEQTTSDLRETLETIEIQNIELDLARKEAVEASRIKSEFLANTSHEIRTPLNGIIGFTNLILKTSLDSQQRDYLETIQKSSEGLLTIINDILDFSKIEAGKLVLDHVPFNLRDIIEETLTILAPSAHDKNLELILLVYSDVPVYLIGDPLRIKQVVTNLISNAIKFTDSGNIVVRVNLESIKDNFAHVTISITDSGIGLSPQQQRDIFTAFTQADTSISREYGGTGLGLVISKKLVEQMGGDLGLQSELGKGSTFRFSIKAKLADQSYKRQFDELRNKRVILIEPNAVLQLSLKHMLENWDLHVHVIEGKGELTEAMLKQQAIEESIHAVVLGVSQKQSREVRMQEAQLLGDFYHCPVIVLSPGATLLPQPHSEKYSNIYYIPKPVIHNKLYKILCSLIYPTRHGVNLDRLSENDSSLLNFANKPKILAVDDNEANLKLISVLLTDLGAEVTVARNGMEAIHLCEDNVFDLIFMDIQMPEFDGIVTSERIRQLPGVIATVPIIALTAHALSEERQRLLDSGFNDHLTKPTNERQLREIISRWCQNTNLPLDATPENVSSENPASEKIVALDKPSAKIMERDSSEGVDPEQRPVDLKLCLKLANNKVDLAKDMLTMLLSGLRREQSNINQAHIDNNKEAFLEAVHKLHGATCYTGVPLLKESTKALETAIKSGSVDDINHYLPTVNAAIDQLLQWEQIHDLDILFQEDEAASL